MGARDVRFRILGPLEVSDNGRVLPLGAPKERALLASLLLRANRVVATDRLIEVLWGAAPPDTARATLQTYVLRLRRTLQPVQGSPSAPLLLTRAPGYLLQVPPDQVDLHQFERLVGEARAATASGDAGQAAERLRQALELWRGPALGGVASMSPLLMGEAARLEEARQAALEERIEAELALGWHARLIGELEALVAEQPLRERSHGQLMLALYRSGRTAEALAAYQAARQVFHDELGLEPGQALQRLQQQILSADPSLEPPAAAPGATPPTRTVRAVPAQLPAVVADFTGRAEDLDELDRLLGGEERGTAVVISAIVGTAGVGKTALAVRWAHQVRDRFPDGQLYVNLRGFAPTPPMRPIQALARFLNALGVPAEQVPVDLDEASGLYRTLLAGRRVLVVLDNARSPEQVRPLLPGTPGCLVVVTSRDRLSGLVAKEGAQRLTLDVLSPREARSLLARILGQQRVAAEPQASADLARVCACLPLALRIVAANLAGQPRRSLAGHVAGLDAGHRLADLEIEGDEQAAVRAAFELSYLALGPEAQRLFRLLGLAPGPDATAEVAAALGDTPVPQAARLLARLAGAHLLGEHASGRYAFHDLLRLYAAERSRQDDPGHDRSAAIRRLLDHYLHTADSAATVLYPEKRRLPVPPAGGGPRPLAGFEDDTQALAWLDGERHNLVAAITYAAEHGPLAAAWLLADTLRGYFYFSMHLVDWLVVAQAALAAAEADGDLRGQAAAELSLANAHMCQGRHQPAIEHCTRALRLNQQAGWLEGQGTVHGSLGLVAWELGRLQEAADHFTQALAITRQTGKPTNPAVNTNNLGLVYQEMGRLEEAVALYTQALALFRKLGSRSNEADSLANLGGTYLELGRLDEAHDHLTQALALHREAGNRRAEAETLRVLAKVHRDAGRCREALELAHSAVTLARDTGYRRHESDALNTLASIHQHLGQLDQAVGLHRQALHLARETQTSYPEAEALIGLATAYRHVGRPDQARSWGEEAVALTRQAGFGLLEGRALATLAELDLALDRPDQAAELARQALARQRDTGHRLGQAQALLVLGHAVRHTEGVAAALPRWRQAYRLLAEIGSPDADRVQALLHASAPTA